MAIPRPEPLLPRWLILNRNFVLLWIAYGISSFGDHVSEMALLKEVGGLGRDNVTRVQALLTFCYFLPFVVLGPLAGWWADRFSRRWTMITSDILRCGVSISMIVTIHPLLRLGWGDWAVAMPLLLTGVFTAFFSPARQAMVPTLIRDNQLVRANALISALGTIAGITSAIVGGILVDLSEQGHFGLYWNYIVDGSTYIISAVLLMGLVMSRSRETERRISEGVLRPVREGFAYVRQHRRILQIILLGTVFWAAAGVVISVVPAIVRDVFAGQYSDAGMYRGLIAAGMAIGAALLTLLGPALSVPLAVLFGVTGGALWVGLLDVAYIFKLGRIFTAMCLFMIGVHGAAILVNVMVVIQRFVPDAKRGRVFGVSDMVTMGALAGATGLLGLPNIPHLDRYIPALLGLVAAGLALTAVLAWREYRRGDELWWVDWLLWRIVRCYTRFWARCERIGPCTIPRHGPVILASNHTAGIDPMAILSESPHRLVSFIVEAKYYQVQPGKWFMDRVHCVALDRDNPQKSFLTKALRLLKDGGLLGIFPEGTYPAPGEPLPEAKQGVGVLALRTHAVVIPCHISGARYAYNPFVSYFQRHNLRIRFGPPVDLTELRARARDKDAPQKAADLIMAKIRALAPQGDRHGT